jgi:hypothetical protein
MNFPSTGRRGINMYEVTRKQLRYLREFAVEPGALFIPLPVQGPVRRVLIWADDINNAQTDEDLVDVIRTAVHSAQRSSAELSNP